MTRLLFQFAIASPPQIHSRASHCAMRLAKSLQAGCRLVMISGHTTVDSVVAALKGGAAGFIVKPYNAMKIHDILSKLER